MRFNKEKIYLIVIILATFLTYLNILHNDFVWDDRDFILEWYDTRSLKNVPLFFKGALPFEHWGVYRPIRSIFYTLSYKLLGINPVGYHLQSILIHLTATVLIYFIALQITNKKDMAFISSLVFGVHPIHTGSISLVVPSFDIIGVIFFLVAFYLYIKSQFDGDKIKLAVSIFFALLAFFSYEIALTLPLMIVLYDTCFRKINRNNLIRKLMIYSFYFVGAFFYLFIRVFVLKIGSRGNYPAGSFYLTMLAMSKAFLKYIYLVILPIKQSINHTISKGILSIVYLDLSEEAMLAQSFFDLHILFSIFVILTLLIIALKNFRKKPMVSFCIGWFFIGLSPVLNIIPQASLLSERYLYISSFAFCLLFSFIFFHVYKTLRKKEAIKIALIIFFIIIILLYSTLTYLRNKDFKDSLSLWSKTAEQAPESVLAHNNLGLVYYDAGDIDLAIEEFKKVISIKPDYYRVYNNLGLAYYEKGGIDLAIEEYKASIALNQNHAESHNNLGLAYYEKGEIDLAIEEYKKAIAINPKLFGVYYNIGLIYKEEGKTNLAIEQFNKAIAINADDARIYYELGKAYYKQEKIDLSIEAYKKALRINRTFKEIYYNIGNAYYAQGEIDAAIESYKKAIALKPDYINASINLGNLYYLKGNIDLAIREYKKVLAVDPDNIKARKNLKLAIEEQGKS